MGSGVSTSFSSLPSNEHLKRLVSKEVITYNDPFWNTLLSFASKIPRTSADSRLLNESVEPLFKSFLQNAPLTGNLSTLITVFLSRSVELEESAKCENSVFLWQAHNALFIVRVICKLLLEQLSETKALELMELTLIDQSSETPDKIAEPLLPKLLKSIIHILTDLPVSASTYHLHTEAITTLIVLLSAHICQPAENTTPTYKVFSCLQSVCGSDSLLSLPLLLSLLTNLIDRHTPPHDEDSGSSFVSGIAAGLWSVLTLGLASGSSAASVTEAAVKADQTTALPITKNLPPSPLADMSVLLMLVLTTHSADSNVFRDALFSAKNTTSEPCVSGDSVSVQYSSLHKALTQGLHTEQTTLLLYLIMHNSKNFRSYLLSLSDIEVVVVPLLQTLHFAPKLSSHHVYMALIILLMLSEDNSFNAALHEVSLPSVSWYSDRPLYNISLGDLLILVLIRTITFNMTKMRDRYLHSNCLAALANMSSQFRSIHPYVCQRIMGLLETLSKKHSKILSAIKQRSGQTSNGCSVGLSGYADAEEELLSDLSVIEEVLRMVLEILNSTLTHQMNHNPHLLYTLLYKRQVFLPFSTQPNFSDVCMNIDVVLNYLMNKLEKTTSDPSVSDVQEVIEQGVLQLPKERLRKFPELKFKYVEESSPEEFFIPYVWTLVYQSSGLHWHSKDIALFDPTEQET